MRRSIVLHRLLRYPAWALSLLATAPACGRIGFEVLGHADAGARPNADDSATSAPSRSDASIDLPAADDTSPELTSDDGTNSATETSVPTTTDAAATDDGTTDDGVTTTPGATQTADDAPAQTDASAPKPDDATPANDDEPSSNMDAGSTTEPATPSVDASTGSPPNELDAGSDTNLLDAGTPDPTDPTQGTDVIPDVASESDASTDASVDAGVALTDASATEVLDAGGPVTPDAGECTPSNTGFESCDGIDNDCDTLIDEDGCPSTCHGAASADNGYMVCDELVGYDVAAAACETQGLLLVTIDSAELNQALNDLLYPADGSMDQLYFWIGASRVDSSSAWTWADGATWGTYANWKNGVPGNAGTANCVQVDDLGRWLAGQCTQTKRYACELFPP